MLLFPAPTPKFCTLFPSPYSLTSQGIDLNNIFPKHFIYFIIYFFSQKRLAAISITQTNKDNTEEAVIKSTLNQSFLFSWQETKRVSTIRTVQKRRPPGPTVIFFAGGYLRRSLDVLECFDPQTLTWSILSPLSVPKSGLGAAYIGNCMIECFCVLLSLLICSQASDT